MSLLYNLKYKTRMAFKGKIALKREVLSIITKELMYNDSNSINGFAASDVSNPFRLEKALIEALVRYGKTNRVQPDKLKEACISATSLIETVCSTLQTTFNTPIYCDIGRSSFAGRVLQELENH